MGDSNSDTGAAGPWWISAKLLGDIEPRIRHDKSKLPEMVKVWSLMRAQYDEPTLESTEIEVKDDETGEFMLSGESDLPVDTTQAALRQLATILMEALGLDAVEYFVADERLSIYRLPRA